MGIPSDSTRTFPADLGPANPAPFDDPDTPIEGPGGPDDGSSHPEITPPPPPEVAD